MLLKPSFCDTNYYEFPTQIHKNYIPSFCLLKNGFSRLLKEFKIENLL